LQKFNEVSELVGYDKVLEASPTYRAESDE
jgi:hypothetical protein